MARGGGQAAEVERQLLGSWRLVSFVVVDEQGTVIGRPDGREPAGKLTYTRAGDIWAHTGQAAPRRSLAPHWYTGAFSVDATRRVVIHRVQYSSIAAWEGTTLLRRYAFAGRTRQRLTLSTLPEGPKGDKTRLVLRWRKVATR